MPGMPISKWLCEAGCGITRVSACASDGAGGITGATVERGNCPVTCSAIASASARVRSPMIATTARSTV